MVSISRGEPEPLPPFRPILPRDGSLPTIYSPKIHLTRKMFQQQPFSPKIHETQNISITAIYSPNTFNTRQLFQRQLCFSAQCVRCKVYFSAQPNKLRPILKFKKYYPIEHIFVPACSSARKIHFFKF